MSQEHWGVLHLLRISAYACSHNSFWIPSDNSIIDLRYQRISRIQNILKVDSHDSYSSYKNSRKLAETNKQKTNNKQTNKKQHPGPEYFRSIQCTRLIQSYFSSEDSSGPK